MIYNRDKELLSKYPMFVEVISFIVLVLGTVFVLYPVIHELGHALAAFLFGGEVVRITVFPAFYTECFIRPDQFGCYVMTSVSGILFPLICSVIIDIRSVRGFLVALCLRVMSVAYSVSEIVCVSKLIMGSSIEKTDLCVLTYETGVDPYASLVLAGLLMILSLLALVSMEPITSFMHWFIRSGIKRYKTATGNNGRADSSVWRG